MCTAPSQPATAINGCPGSGSSRSAFDHDEAVVVGRSSREDRFLDGRRDPLRVAGRDREASELLALEHSVYTVGREDEPVTPFDAVHRQVGSRGSAPAEGTVE